MRIVLGVLGCLVAANGWVLGFGATDPRSETRFLIGLACAVVGGVVGGVILGGARLRMSAAFAPPATAVARTVFSIGWVLQALGGLAVLWNGCGLVGAALHHSPVRENAQRTELLARGIALSVSGVFGLAGFGVRLWVRRVKHKPAEPNVASADGR